MKKFIVTEQQLREANLLFFKDSKPYLRDGREGIYLQEYTAIAEPTKWQKEHREAILRDMEDEYPH
jgi:hypothetical protein